RGCISDYSAPRNLYDKVFCALAKAVLRTSVCAVFRAILSLKAEINERVHVVINHEHHISALSAVSAVRTACGYILFSVEGNAAVAAVSCRNGYLYFIYKHTSTSCPFNLKRQAYAWRLWIV